MKRFLIYSFGVLGLMLASCTSTSQLYAWHNYEKTSYDYTKNPNEKTEQKLLESYQKMINRPTGARKVVAPGVYAELGYLQMQMGQKDAAVQNFKQEIELYPESTLFITKIIKSIKE